MKRLTIGAGRVRRPAGAGLPTTLAVRRVMHRREPPAAAASAASGAGRKVLYWHDPMVPGQRFDKPGKSPFMDMQLVPVYADSDPAEGVFR